MNRRSFIGGSLGGLVASKVDAKDVGITALILVNDISSSMDEGPGDRLELMRAGTWAALNDPGVRAMGHERVAVAIVEFGANASVALDWSLMNRRRSFERMDCNEVSRSATSIASGVKQAIALLDSCPWRKDRVVFDISGDGEDNLPEAGKLKEVLDAVPGTVNGLPIRPNPMRSIPEYYNNHVIRGSDAFIEIVEDMESYAEAMIRKIRREIA